VFTNTAYKQSEPHYGDSNRHGLLSSAYKTPQDVRHTGKNGSVVFFLQILKLLKRSVLKRSSARAFPCSPGIWALIQSYEVSTIFTCLHIYHYL